MRARVNLLKNCMLIAEDEDKTSCLHRVALLANVGVFSAEKLVFSPSELSRLVYDIFHDWVLNLTLEVSVLITSHLSQPDMYNYLRQSLHRCRCQTFAPVSRKNLTEFLYENISVGKEMLFIFLHKFHPVYKKPFVNTYIILADTFVRHKINTVK